VSADGGQTGMVRALLERESHAVESSVPLQKQIDFMLRALVGPWARQVSQSRRIGFPLNSYIDIIAKLASTPL
jgi:hypothetical protein